MSRDSAKRGLHQYQASCRRGINWLLDRIDENGAAGPTEDRLYYYRLPWTLALTGETAAAHACLDWIKAHMFTPAGSFEGVSPQGVFEERYGSYPLACLLVGAQMLGRYDVVYPGTDSLMDWQDPESGGVYNTLSNASETGEQELFPTAQFGMTCIALGRLAEAKKAGLWMQNIWDLQPDVEQKLHHVFSRASGLISDIPGNQQALYITRKDDSWQHHFNGGIAAAFLSKLHLATGDACWLELARSYQEFSMTTDSCQFRSMQLCKSGWGSGLLYAITRERAYYHWTRRLGDWFVRLQYADGHWENTHYWNPVPTEADNIEITAEFVMHLTHIIGNMSLPRSTES